jgi:spore coat protein F
MENHYSPDHLAWHETLEIHELTAFLLDLMKLKKASPEVTDPTLKERISHRRFPTFHAITSIRSSFL